MTPKIRTVFFDAAGTLIGLPKGVAHHYCDVAMRHGREIDPRAMHEAFRMAWKEATPPPATRMPREDDDKSWWRSLVDRVLDRCDVTPGDAFDRDAYFAELYNEFTKPGVWELFPEVREVLDRLQSHFRLGIVSNFDRRLVTVLGELGVGHLFDPVVISTEVGADKPDPWIFQQALLKAGARPEETLHVGDEPAADWEGAAAMGMQVYRLKRPDRDLRGMFEDETIRW